MVFRFNIISIISLYYRFIFKVGPRILPDENFSRIACMFLHSAEAYFIIPIRYNGEQYVFCLLVSVSKSPVSDESTRAGTGKDGKRAVLERRKMQAEAGKSDVGSSQEFGELFFHPFGLFAAQPDFHQQKQP